MMKQARLRTHEQQTYRIHLNLFYLNKMMLHKQLHCLNKITKCWELSKQSCIDLGHCYYSDSEGQLAYTTYHLLSHLW